jgi:hypothetical protein
MKPCTSYTWQMKRVPYTTYRPVYRTESYTVPVTYTSMAPSPCAPAQPCATCPTMGVAQTGCATCGPNYANPVVAGYPMALPPNTLSTNGNYTSLPTIVESSPIYQSSPAAIGSGVPNGATLAPADQVPTLGKPIIIDRREIVPDSSSFQAPALTPTNTGLQGVRPIRDPHPNLRWDNRPAEPNVEDQTAAAPTRKSWDYSPIRLASHTQRETLTAPGEPKIYRGELQIEAPAQQVNSAWKNVD